MQTPTEEERQALDAAIDAATTDAPQITLMPPPASPMRWLDGANSCHGKWSDESWFQRAHGQHWTAPWFGQVAMQDQHGRWWHRHFDAVIDDFGNLAEVPKC